MGNRVRVFLLAGIVLGLMLPGCSGSSEDQPALYRNQAFGSSFLVPAGWEMTAETEREVVLTLQLQDKTRETSFMTVTVFPASLMSQEESAGQAEQLLRQGLYELQEPVEQKELSLSSGRTLPLVKALAGRREMVEAWSAVLCGSRFHALVTLVARLEHFDIHKTEFHLFLESYQLE